MTARAPRVVPEHERMFVRSFVVERKQQRFLECLAEERKSFEVVHSLADQRHLDARFMMRIPRREQTVERIVSLLHARGAPREAYLLCMLKDSEGVSLPLQVAVERLYGAGVGGMISCLPGRLAYWEGEMLRERFILSHP